MSKLQNIRLKVVGVTFTNEDTGISRQQVLSSLDPCSAIFLEREPNNKHDKNAIKVMSLNGQIGYVGKDYASILSEMMDAGRSFKASIAELDIYKNNYYMQINVDEV